MSRFFFVPFVFVAVLMAVTPPAHAQTYEGFAARDLNLRAGPARDYPVVAVVPAGTLVDVQGCLPDFSWCDVIAYGERGWVYAANIEYFYSGAPVPLIDYGPAIGITVVPFFLPDYWDRHYRGRPWYRHRDEWMHRPPPVYPRPRPLPPPVMPRPIPPPEHVPPVRPMPPPRPPQAAPPVERVPPVRPMPLPQPVPSPKVAPPSQRVEPVRPMPPQQRAAPAPQPPARVAPPRSVEPRVDAPRPVAPPRVESNRPPSSTGDK